MKFLKKFKNLIYLNKLREKDYMLHKNVQKGVLNLMIFIFFNHSLCLEL